MILLRYFNLSYISKLLEVSCSQGKIHLLFVIINRDLWLIIYFSFSEARVGMMLLFSCLVSVIHGSQLIPKLCFLLNILG